MSIFIVLLLLLLVIYFITLPQIFAKAGEDSWKGYVPVYNFITWLKILKRPWWWVILLFIPGVNLIMFSILHVETAIAFGKRSVGDQWFAGLLPWVFLPKLAFSNAGAKWIGPRDWEGKKKTIFREWGEAIIFAVVAASIIRSFFLEAFTIPTPSMEGSMLVGDYLFVSKMSYGPRLPETPLSIPFVHNVIPGSMRNSYLEWIKLPDIRLPGFGDVERYDAVVFNFPHGDTVLVHPTFISHDYYNFLREEAKSIAGSYEKYAQDPEKYKALARKNFTEKKYCKPCGSRIGGVKARPVDKEDNYVKRCIGMPGDDLEIKHKQVYINGAPMKNPDKLQFVYYIRFKEGKTNFGLKKMAKEFHLLLSEIDRYRSSRPDLNRTVALTNDEYEKVKSWKITDVDKCYPLEDEYGVNNNMESLFPNANHPEYLKWTRDNYGPIHIPAQGETVTLDKNSLPFYKRVIQVYEGNDLKVDGDKIYINGKETDQYTFKQNYYWMMGDNRHNSADSRYWGYVPEDHVVGKALFTWFSKEDKVNHGDNKIRWKRMFKTVDRPE